MRDLTINDKIERMAVIESELKALKCEYNITFKEVFNIILSEVKAVRSEPKYKDTKKSGILTIVKTNLQISTKTDISNICFNFYALGLSIDLTDTKVSKAFIKDIIKYVKNGKITKTKVNKSSNDDIRKMIAKEKMEENIAKYTKTKK